MNTRRNTPTVLLISAATLTASMLMLAGCSSPAPDDRAEPDPTPVPSQSTEPTRPDLDELQLIDIGLGEVQIGAPVPTLDDPDLASVVYDPEGCAIDGADPADGRGGIWYGAYPDAPTVFGDDAQPFYLTTEGAAQDAAVTAIVVSSGVSTATGIELGSSRDDVLAAYDDSLQLTEGSLSDTYATVSDAGSLVIEVAKPVSGDYWPGELIDTVVALRALSPGLDTGPVAGTDAFSPCAV